MIVGGSYNVHQQLASVYNSNNRLLADILSRIASGKKLQRPSDNFVGYIRAENLETEIEGYETVKQNLTEAEGVADMAAEAGSGIYEDITRMETLVGLYWDTEDADLRTTYTNEYNALKTNITNTILNTKYEGVAIISDAFTHSVDLDPDGSGSLTIDFDATDIVSTAAMTIGDTDEATDLLTVDPQVIRASSYLVKAEGFGTMIARHINITDTIIASKESAASLITDIDEAEELNNQVNMQVRQQAAVAMMAQANLLRGALSRLYYNG